jgi:acyl dehydratase
MFFEDLCVGETFKSGTYEVSAEEIVTFARQYDPQPSHVNPLAGAPSVFGRHVASGWHTAAITMRLLVESEFRPAGGSVGVGIDSLRWTLPVVPGDVLHLEVAVAELRESRSKPHLGVVKLDVLTRNAAGDAVQKLMLVCLVPRRRRAEA